MSSVQPTNYLFRVGDASHLWSSSEFNIWGIHSNTSGSKFFLKNVKPGDVLWFVKGKSKGLIVATAIYEYSIKRVNGECMPFEQLGWVNVPGSWDTDIHFKNFKKIEHMRLLSQIKGSAANPRVYNKNCLVNLPEMYTQIYPSEELVQSIDLNVRQEMFEGTSYLITTNGDIQDEQIKKFAVALIKSSINNSDEDEVETDDEDKDEDKKEDEKAALEKILDTCLKINDEITQLILSLNTRLAKL
jgi:hypothetical protein